MIACNDAAPRAKTTALAVRQSAAMKRRRADEGHPSQERSAMSQSSHRSIVLDQLRRQSRLAAMAHAKATQTLATIRQLAVDLADSVHAAEAALNAIEAYASEVATKPDCKHPARGLRYLGLHEWTGGPAPVHAAECSRALGGCGQLIVLGRDGGARAVDGGSRFMPSTLAG